MEILMNFVYIVECKDGTLYTGWTNNIEKRIELHNKAKGAKYTQTRYPVVLKYIEAFSSKEDALKREHSIKKLSRQEKIELIKSFSP